MSQKNNFTWPIYFPVDVPPSDVIAATGEAFRLVDNVPPTAADFMSYYEEDPTRTYDTAEKKVKSYGISLWTSESKIRRGLRNYPNKEQFAAKKIVKGMLIPSLGVIPEKKSTRGHITLWKCDNASPHLHLNIEVQ